MHWNATIVNTLIYTPVFNVTTYVCNVKMMRSSHGFWGGGQGNKGIYFRETGEQRLNFEGNRGTKAILGNRIHKKTNF